MISIERLLVMPTYKMENGSSITPIGNKSDNVKLGKLPDELQKC